MTQKNASNEQIKKDWAAQASAKEIASATKAATDGIGHNSDPRVNPELQQELEAIHKLMDSRKALNSEIKESIAQIKEKFGTAARVVRDLISLQRMDPGARAVIEQGRHDIKIMTGYDLLNWQDRIEEDGSKETDPLEAAAKEEKKEA